jgi:hypothetical protein
MVLSKKSELAIFLLFSDIILQHVIEKYKIEQHCQDPSNDLEKLSPLEYAKRIIGCG